WDHSREIIAKVLTEKYLNLAATGWEPSGAEIQRDVEGLFGGSFQRFLGR
ncbi:MAG: glucuronate isomerase, partial [Verrucomicrobia bacterium]|nr:glucuronate isomerase [Verrucomicrobiota bacterium]